MYNQLTLAQRYTISTMRQNGFSLKAIADELNRIEEEAAISSGNPLPEKKRSASTISRESKRNRTKTGRYNPKQADEMAREKRERIVRNTAIKPGVLEFAIKLLKGKGWSPEQISGHLKKEGKRISKERIYQEIRRKPEQGFSKKKYYPQGWRFFLKTIEHPNPGFTFAPRTGTIHLLRLSERPSKMEVNGCGGILDMNVQGKERKEMSKKRCGENVKSANIPRKYVATVWLNLFSYAVAIFFPVCRHG